MGSSEDFIRQHLCTKCHVKIMEDHPTLMYWLKCNFCGFCKKVK